MLRLLVVDDEPMFREGLIGSINWNQLGIRIAAEAYNGREALKVLAEQKIDIVLTDIRMPEMDGLELIEEAAKLYPALRFIVLSAFDDFYLVKKAFGLGIVDYILKSEVRESDLREILSRHSRELPQQPSRRDAAVYAEQSNRLLVKHLVRSAVERRLSLTESPVLSGLFDSEPEAAVYCAFFSLHLSDFSGNVESAVIKMDEAAEAIEVRIDSLDKWVGYRDDLFFVVFHFPHQPLCWRDFSRSTDLLRCELQDLVPDGVVISAGINSLKRSSFLSRPKIEAERACLLSFFRDTGGTFGYNRYQETLSRPDFYAEPIFRRFAEYLRNRDIRGLLEKSGSFIVPPLAFNASSRSEILQLFSKFYYHLLSFCEQMGIDTDEEVVRSLRIFTVLQKGLAPLTVYNRWFVSFLKLLLSTTEGRNSLANRVIRYLQSHYSEDLTLSETADYFQVNPSYLSRVFSRQVGRGFNSYLTELRVSKARQLLETGNLKVYEVAEQTGFHNPESFSRIFKRKTGMAPRELLG